MLTFQHIFEGDDAKRHDRGVDALEELLDALTVLERFLYVSALAPKLVANAEAAQETGEEQA